MTDGKEIISTPFYLPLHHSMRTVGISAMFHSLEPTSSLGVGKTIRWVPPIHIWMGSLLALLNVLSHPICPLKWKYTRLKITVYFNTKPSLFDRTHFELRTAAGTFCWFCLRNLKKRNTQAWSRMCQSDIERLNPWEHKEKTWIQSQL